MRKLWQGAASVALAVVFGLAGMAPAHAQARDAQARLARGAYLTESIVACGNCHTPKGPQGELPGMALAGGFIIDEPAMGFRAVVPNITPDPETGIGRWTDEQIGRAIREGIRPDGSVIGPPMPIELYRRISDADLAAMVAYLRTVPPVRHAVTERSRYAFPLPPNYGPPVGTVAGPGAQATPAERGAYLAGPLGHCIECHTPMLAGGQHDWARTGGGGPPIHGPFGPVVPRNITPDRSAGIGAWTDAQIIRAVTQGISADGRRLMPPMAFPYYARIRPEDLADLVAYLRSLPPQP